jgi:hypothetical protein
LKELTQAQKEELKAKLAEERSQKHQKERRLFAYKQQYKRYKGSSSGVGGAFTMGGSSGAQSYSSRLTAAKREQAFEHVFDKDEPLRQMKLSQAQKAALKKKIAEHQAEKSKGS